MTPSIIDQELAALSFAFPTTIVQTVSEEKNLFTIPALPKARCLVLPLLRETIAPAIIRNNDADLITDQFAAGVLRIRMIASKLKGVERRRGSQILRSLGLSTNIPTNRERLTKGKQPHDVFDLNTFVFGGSATGPNDVYPVHAAVLYSDAISLDPSRGHIDGVFRQGGISDDGGNYDAEKHKTSNNIFTTYSVTPGTRFVQTIVIPGHRLTLPAFDHLLLSIGLSGAYGGATATTGTNFRTIPLGLFVGAFERPINAPIELLTQLDDLTQHTAASLSTPDVATHIAQLFGQAYPYHVTRAVLMRYITELIEAFEQNDPDLIQRYTQTAADVASLFDAWFKKSQPANSSRSQSGSSSRGRSKTTPDIAQQTFISDTDPTDDAEEETEGISL